MNFKIKKFDKFQNLPGVASESYSAFVLRLIILQPHHNTDMFKRFFLK